MNEKLNLLLIDVSFGEPFKSLFNPVLEFTGNNESVLIIKLTMPEINSGLNIELASRHPITTYQADRYSRRPADLMEFIRLSLMERLAHELDESFLFKNKNVNAPKHWGPTEEDMEEIRKSLK